MLIASHVSKLFGRAIIVVLLVAGSLVFSAATPPPVDAQASPLDSVIIVLDVSGSMNIASGTEPGLSRLEVAKRALTGAVDDLDPGSINLGLRTFAGCGSDLVVPVAPADPSEFSAAVDNVSAGGLTGIDEALRSAVADLPSTGTRTVLLVSDGVETCGGDPCSAAAELQAQNVTFVVNTVGFQTADTPAEQQLQCIADASGGTMTAVDNLEELLKSIEQTVQRCTTPLIECYAPEVRFHPSERYFPMDPAAFIEGSELQWVHAANGRTRACFQDEIIDDDPEPDFLGQPVYFAQQQEFSPVLWNPRRCKRYGRSYSTIDFTRPYSEGPGNDLFSRATDDQGAPLDVEEGFELLWTDYGLINIQLEEPDGLHNDPGAGASLNAPIYAQLVNTGAERFIVYHMFYGFDPKSVVDLSDFNAAQLGDQLLAHEGDWERIIVVLGADDVPTEVRFLGHGCKGAEFEETNYAPWSTRLTGDVINTETGRLQVVDGTHPVVYVAEGSHASYPYVRSTGERACTTDGGQASGTADQTQFEADSVSWRPWVSNNVVDPQSQCWYGYGGSWGRGGNLDFGIGTPIDLPGDKFDLGEVRSHDTGPVGPHYNVTGLAAGNSCQTRTLSVSVLAAAPWGSPVTVTLTGQTPGTPVLVSLASLELGVATGTVGGDGSVTVDFTVPQGFGPGGHRIIVRSQTTGDILAVEHITVEIDDACLAPGIDPIGDIDGDNVANSCDVYPADGPVADFDGDGVINFDDNCPRVPNPGQQAKGRASVGTACDIDTGFNPATQLLQELAAGPPATPTPEPTETPTTPTPEPTDTATPTTETPTPTATPIAETPMPTATAEPAIYEPPTVAPPDRGGAFGFGNAANPVASIPVPAPVPVPEFVVTEIPAALAAAAPVQPQTSAVPLIADTGSEDVPIVAFGTALIGAGFYYLGMARTRRRR